MDLFPATSDPVVFSSNFRSFLIRAQKERCFVPIMSTQLCICQTANSFSLEAQSLMCFPSRCRNGRMDWCVWVLSAVDGSKTSSLLEWVLAFVAVSHMDTGFIWLGFVGPQVWSPVRNSASPDLGFLVCRIEMMILFASYILQACCLKLMEWWMWNYCELCNIL